MARPPDTDRRMCARRASTPSAPTPIIRYHRGMDTGLRRLRRNGSRLLAPALLLVSACAAPIPIRELPAGADKWLARSFSDYGQAERRAPIVDEDLGLPETPN